jgi:hypothetical protein
MENDSKLKEDSRIAAEIVVDALIMAEIIKREDFNKAVDITEEEILVRKIMQRL